MHKAPSVAYPVGPCSFERWVYAGVTALTSMLLLAWGMHQGIHFTWGLAAGLATLGAVWGGRAMRQVGFLLWDGHTWRWLSPHAAHETVLRDVAVTLDFQKVLLLRGQALSNSSRQAVVWLWLSQSAQPPHWQDLRRAVHQASATP